MATSQSGSTAGRVRPTYRNADGEKVSQAELEEGDTFVARVKWFDDWKARPVHFTVTRTENITDDVKARGTDGHKYKFYGDRPHIECLTDDKEGYHRGQQTGRHKRL